MIIWLLPNGKVRPGSVLPAAIIMGLLSEVLKYAYILALPRLNFQEVDGPFLPLRQHDVLGISFRDVIADRCPSLRQKRTQRQLG